MENKNLLILPEQPKPPKTKPGSIGVRLWHSATVASWTSLIARTLSMGFLLPFVLARFPVPEVALWCLLMSIRGYGLIADMGFSTTFTRVIAYALGGAEDIGGLIDASVISQSKGENIPLVAQLCSTMHHVYLRISLIWFVLLATAGTAFMIRPILQNEGNWTPSWLAWIFFVLTSSLGIYGNRFVSFLIGINKIAFYRRWEALFWMITFLAGLTVMIFKGGFLSLVFAVQGLIILQVGVNWFFYRRFSEAYRTSAESFPRSGLFAAIWPNSWRCGLGVLIGTLVVQGTGIFYAQIGSSASIASYLLALNVIRILGQFSRAPFNTKIPILALFHARGELSRQKHIAEVGFRRCLFILAAGIIIVGFWADPLLSLIGSRVEFVDPCLWALLGLAAFSERYGAMHLQLYTTTNHIITHIANGVTGIFFLISAAACYPYLGLYAFPLCQILSNLGFYDWYAARHSYRAFQLRFREFEKKTSLVPFSMLLFYSLLAFSQAWRP